MCGLLMMMPVSQKPDSLSEQVAKMQYCITVHGDCGKDHASVEEWRACPTCKTMLRDAQNRGSHQW